MRKTPGRPSHPDAHLRKLKLVVCLAPHEMEAIRDAAARVGVSMASLLRQLALRAAREDRAA